MALSELTPGAIRKWHAQLMRSPKIGEVTVAKVYRLVRAILATATEDDLIIRNPAKLKKAGIERSPERPTATPEQVMALAYAIDLRFRAAVLLGAFGTVRLGEPRALTRSSLDFRRGTLTIRDQLVELSDGTILAHRPPKSDAGHRTVSMPAAILGDLAAHVDRYAAEGRKGYLFVNTKGGRCDGAPFTRPGRRRLPPWVSKNCTFMTCAM